MDSLTCWQVWRQSIEIHGRYVDCIGTYSKLNKECYIVRYKDITVHSVDLESGIVQILTQLKPK